jgi:hypothetical protein
MPAQIEINQKAIRRFHEAIVSLARMSGGDFKTVIKSELGIVFSQTVKNMKKASVAVIQQNQKNQPGAAYGIEYSGPVSQTGKQYSPQQIEKAKRRAADARARGKNGKALYYLPGSRNPNRYPNWLWSQIKQFREQSLLNKKQARGLAARMWVHISDQLNIPISAPGYVRNASHHKKGSMSQAVIAHESSNGKDYRVGFINALTKTNRWAGHAGKKKSPNSVGSTFRIALNKRANFFSQSVKLKAKGIIKNTLDRYPGMARVY